MYPIVYLNGEYLPRAAAKLHCSDLAILRGYGIFDYFRYAAGRPRFLADHVERFQHSAAAMGLELPLVASDLGDVVHQLIERNGEADGGIRFVLTGGYAPDGYTPTQPNLLAMAYPHKPPPPEQFTKGCTVLLHTHERQLPHVKTTDYIEGIRLLPKLRAAGADYPVYVDAAGYLRESDRSNVFAVKAGRLITPAAGVLAGITRKHLLVLAGRLGLPTEERPLPLTEFLAADEAIIASSTKGAMPITRTDRGPIADGRVGPVTQRLMDAWPGYCAEFG